MPNSVVTKISERRRNELRFKRIGERLNLIESIVVHQAKRIEVMTVDKIILSEVVAEMTARPWWCRRVKFTAEIMQTRRDALLAARAQEAEERERKLAEKVKAEPSPAQEEQEKAAS